MTLYQEELTVNARAQVVTTLLVLGMHRSGTSAVAGALTLLGAAAPKTLMPANAFNERGHWESNALMDFNDRLLRSAGSDWDDWRAFNPGWYQAGDVESLKRDAADVIRAEFEDRSLIVVKDPRICRFAPFWLDVLDDMAAAPTVVIPVRSPLEVAHSLKRRDGFPTPKGVLLWLRHVLDAEIATRGRARVVFSWNSFLKDWRYTAECIAQEMGVSWPSLSDSNARKIDDFLSGELRHEAIPDSRLHAHPEVDEWARLAYEAMLTLANEPNSAAAYATLDDVRQKFERACKVFGRVALDYEQALTSLKSERTSLQSELASLQSEYGALHSGLGDLSADRERWIARSEHLEGELAGRGQEIAQLADELSAARSERDGATTRLSQLETELAAADQAHAAKVAELEAALEVELAAANQASTTKLAELEVALEAELAEADQANTAKVAEIKVALAAAEAKATENAELGGELKAKLAAKTSRVVELEAALVRLASERNSVLGDLASIRADEKLGYRRDVLRWHLSLSQELATEVRKVRRHPWRPLAQRSLWYLFSALAFPFSTLGARGVGQFLQRQGDQRTPRRLGTLANDADSVSERLRGLEAEGDRPPLAGAKRRVLVADHRIPRPDAGVLEDLGALGYEVAFAPMESDFDPDFYAKAYPDVVATGMDLEEHFNRFGRQEGRLGKLPKIPGLEKLSEMDRQRDTILVVAHEGSRTGAPMLVYNLAKELTARFNVVVLFLGPGPLIEACDKAGAFALGPVNRFHPLIVEGAISAILARTSLRFAIVNSIECRMVLPHLTKGRVPTVNLIHEFAAYTKPNSAFYESVLWAGRTVFSSDLTRDNAKENNFSLRDIPFPVIAQGRCDLPESEDRGAAASVNLRPSNFPADGLVIVGMGTVQIRKGVDLFIDCARRIRESAPDLPIRFTWIGRGYDPENDHAYSMYLPDQIERAGLSDILQIIDELDDLEEVYAAADLLLLPSRLDPLPNVAIDALSEGLPVFCFERATGVASILHDNGLSQHCVAPYLDTARMAEQVLAFARSPSLRKKLSKRAKEVAATTFDMRRYVDRLVELAEQERAVTPQLAEDERIVCESNVLDANYFPASGSGEERALKYIRSWASGAERRKPFPGFHPGIYREAQGLAVPGGDPLADYLRSGRPKGPWCAPVILSSGEEASQVQGRRVALHIHAYYPDDVETIMAALGATRTQIDLLVSVADETGRERVSEILKDYRRGGVDIRITPNAGRDLGPFCTAFADKIQREYDFIGHIHTKRSVGLQAQVTRTWVNFLFANLLGSEGGPSMADRILGVLAEDPNIGLVFPDEPHVLSWGENRLIAEALGKRMGIAVLPENIDFPAGTMFWARVAALKPLWALKLDWRDYPDEPLPYDGTMLHALERLLPLIVKKAGFRYAVSHVPGVSR